MNILSIDYGKKRIGLAWVNTDLGVVLPYGQLLNPNSELLTQGLIKLIQEEKVEKVIIGLPIGLDGKENANTVAVRKFSEALTKAIDLPIEFVDERFTSAEADRMGGDVSRDEKAAMLILQAYVDRL